MVATKWRKTRDHAVGVGCKAWPVFSRRGPCHFFENGHGPSSARAPEQDRRPPLAAFWPQGAHPPRPPSLASQGVGELFFFAPGPASYEPGCWPAANRTSTGRDFVGSCTTNLADNRVVHPRFDPRIFSARTWLTQARPRFFCDYQITTSGGVFPRPSPTSCLPRTITYRRRR